jgi:hypothetical protein
VAAEIAAFFEAMPKQLRQESFIFRKSNDAVPHISGRKHVEILTEPPAGAAIITHGDYGTEFSDARRVRCDRFSGNVLLQAL